MAKKKSEVRLTLRIPEPIHHKLRLIAAENSRSLNSEIIFLIKRHVAVLDSDLIPPAPRDDAAE